jgi:hypothetical protein
VQNCDKIFRTMLADGRVASLLLEVDCAKGSTGLSTATRSWPRSARQPRQTQRRALWVLEGILYRIEAEDPPGCPFDHGPPRQQRQRLRALHLLLMKLELKNQLFKRTLVELRDGQRVLDRDPAPKFASRVEFEEAYEVPSADLSWCSGLKKYEEELLNQSSETVFGTRYDSTIRQALKQGPAPAAASWPLFR